MTDLSGNTLRKELIRELRAKVGHCSQCGEDFSAFSCGPTHALMFEEKAPKYESDATLFFGLLDRVCKERGWAWEMWRPANDLCHCAILTERRLLIASEEHRDVPTAGARCLLSALRSVK